MKLTFETQAKIEYAAVVSGIVALLAVPLLIMNFS